MVSDPDSVISIIQWSSQRGGTFGDATMKDTTWTAPTERPTQDVEYPLVLDVTDSHGNTNMAAVTITVIAAIVLPGVSFAGSLLGSLGALVDHGTRIVDADFTGGLAGTLAPVAGLGQAPDLPVGNVSFTGGLAGTLAPAVELAYLITEADFTGGLEGTLAPSIDHGTRRIDAAPTGDLLGSLGAFVGLNQAPDLVHEDVAFTGGLRGLLAPAVDHGTRIVDAAPTGDLAGTLGARAGLGQAPDLPVGNVGFTGGLRGVLSPRLQGGQAPDLPIGDVSLEGGLTGVLIPAAAIDQPTGDVPFTGGLGGSLGAIVGLDQAPDLVHEDVAFTGDLKGTLAPAAGLGQAPDLELENVAFTGGLEGTLQGTVELLFPSAQEFDLTGATFSRNNNRSRWTFTSNEPEIEAGFGVNRVLRRVEIRSGVLRVTIRDTGGSSAGLNQTFEATGGFVLSVGIYAARAFVPDNPSSDPYYVLTDPGFGVIHRTLRGQGTPTAAKFTIFVPVPVRANIPGELAGTLSARVDHATRLISAEIQGGLEGTLAPSIDHGTRRVDAALTGDLLGSLGAFVGLDQAPDLVHEDVAFTGDLKGTLVPAVDHGDRRASADFTGGLAGTLVPAIDHGSSLASAAFAGELLGSLGAFVGLDQAPDLVHEDVAFTGNLRGLLAPAIDHGDRRASADFTGGLRGVLVPRVRSGGAPDLAVPDVSFDGGLAGTLARRVDGRGRPRVGLGDAPDLGVGNVSFAGGLLGSLGAIVGLDQAPDLVHEDVAFTGDLVGTLVARVDQGDRRVASAFTGGLRGVLSPRVTTGSAPDLQLPAVAFTGGLRGLLISRVGLGDEAALSFPVAQSVPDDWLAVGSNVTFSRLILYPDGRLRVQLSSSTARFTSRASESLVLSIGTTTVENIDETQIFTPSNSAALVAIYAGYTPGTRLTISLTHPAYQTTAEYDYTLTTSILAASAPEVGSMAAVGVDKREVLPCVVSGVKALDKLHAEVSLLPLSNDIHDAETGPIPAYDPLITIGGTAVGVFDDGAIDGLDGVDGHGVEYIFASSADGSEITGDANLPDPNWNFDVVAAAGTDRGTQTYYDGTPADLSPTRPYSIRFRRPVPGNPTTGADIGEVEWTQEMAVYLWARDGLDGDGRDGEDGFATEYIFTAKANATAISGNNLPDASWNYDRAGLSSGVTKGNQKYYDGEPADLSKTKPFRIRFRRRLQGFPSANSDIGSVTWTQEAAIRVVPLDGEDGDDGNGIEYIFTAKANATAITTANEPLASWNYDHNALRTNNGALRGNQRYYDGTPPDVSASKPYMIRFRRTVPGNPAQNSDIGNVSWTQDAAVRVWGRDGQKGVNGTDGVGVEYVFTSKANGTAISEANSPDADWNYDHDALRTTNGATRGSQKYFDGTPPDISATRQFMIRFSRKITGAPAQNEDVGTVEWTQEAAIRVWGRDGQKGRDGTEGFGIEYIFTAKATSDRISKTADLPDDNWNYDHSGLRAVGGAERGDQAYYDGAPSDLSVDKPYQIRFHRVVPANVERDDDIGEVVWSQEAAVRAWGEAGAGIESIFAASTDEPDAPSNTWGFKTPGKAAGGRVLDAPIVLDDVGSGSWTVPEGIIEVRVQLVGGGGGGGTGEGSGGGGGGGTTWNTGSDRKRAGGGGGGAGERHPTAANRGFLGAGGGGGGGDGAEINQDGTEYLATDGTGSGGGGGNLYGATVAGSRTNGGPDGGGKGGGGGASARNAEGGRGDTTNGGTVSSSLRVITAGLSGADSIAEFAGYGDGGNGELSTGNPNPGYGGGGGGYTSFVVSVTPGESIPYYVGEGGIGGGGFADSNADDGEHGVIRISNPPLGEVPWKVAALDLSATSQNLWQADRDIIGAPDVGAAIAGKWGAPRIIGRYGRDGRSGTNAILQNAAVQTIHLALSATADLYGASINLSGRGSSSGAYQTADLGTIPGGSGFSVAIYGAGSVITGAASDHPLHGTAQLKIGSGNWFSVGRSISDDNVSGTLSWTRFYPSWATSQQVQFRVRVVSNSGNAASGSNASLQMFLSKR